MPRHIILGAGAVGGALGGRLGLASREVVLLARGDHLAALRQRGLRLRTPDEDRTQYLRAIAGPEEIELDFDDILILTTKTQQANEVLFAGPTLRYTTTARYLAQQVSTCRSSLRSMESPPRRLRKGTSSECSEYAFGCRLFIWYLAR
ncbi:MAG TPA: 2-dehydropantoate 2-reductase N-terminal domain-containing protein [Propionibacteriaceae bacterium]|nr:2-dehydropantoate 2-reductase N-terminal domain-containing protein [Propionibacteriaceae bacterium]